MAIEAPVCNNNIGIKVSDGVEIEVEKIESQVASYINTSRSDSSYKSQYKINAQRSSCLASARPLKKSLGKFSRPRTLHQRLQLRLEF